MLAALYLVKGCEERGRLVSTPEKWPLSQKNSSCAFSCCLARNPSGEWQPRRNGGGAEEVSAGHSEC